MLDLQDKNIIVSGASSGIGRACAIKAANRGARIIMIGRNEERLQESMNSLAGHDHILIKQDITDYPALQKAITELSLEIHGVVHSAGIDLTKPFALTKADDFRNLMEVNLIAGLELIRITSKRKNIPETGASYIFISSVMAELGAAGLSAYCASKSSITSTVKAIALELAAKKIRINAVLPGYINTPLRAKSFNMMTPEEVESIYRSHPLGIGEPEDVANLVLFLLADESRWITGQNIVIDGGYSAG